MSSQNALAEIDRQQVIRYWDNNVSSDFIQSGAPPTVPLLARIRHNQEIKRLKKLLCHNLGGTLLELGCGSGRNSIELAPFFSHITGVDISAEQIKQFNQEVSRRNIKNMISLVADITQLQLDQQYSVIFLGGVTEYLDRAEFKSVMSKVNQWLLPHGIVISRDTFNYSTDAIRETPGYAAFFRTWSSFTNILQEAGFVPITSMPSYFMIFDDLARRLKIQSLPAFFYYPLILVESVLNCAYRPALYLRQQIFNPHLNTWHGFSVWRKQIYST